MRQDDAWFERQRQSATRPPWWFWVQATRHATPLIGTFGRFEITGSVDRKLLDGPLLIAPNHIGNFDTFVVAAAMGRMGIQPKFLATAGIMSAPVVGQLLEKSGSLRVNRGKDDAARSMELVDLALESGSHLCIYPEGRVSLDPHLWPERGKTGLARIALKHRVPVIPVSQWGAHEVTTYEDTVRMLTSTVSSVWRRPRLRVHFGDPVDLADLNLDTPGDAVRARDRIIADITRNLVPLRADEPAVPKFADPTRPVADKVLAAYPGGVVPPDAGRR